MAALFGRLVLLSCCVSVSECILCYQCADSSDNEGKNRCQTYTRTMNRYRERYTESYSVNKYVKNCTGYKGLHDYDIFCMILEVKDTFEDRVRSYIRGCTDGLDFLDVDASVEIDLKINYENRTQCVNINNGLEACITLCGPQYGDFCNGYVSQSARLAPHRWLVVLVVMLYFVNVLYRRAIG